QPAKPTSASNPATARLQRQREGEATCHLYCSVFADAFMRSNPPTGEKAHRRLRNQTSVCQMEKNSGSLSVFAFPVLFSGRFRSVYMLEFKKAFRLAQQGQKGGSGTCTPFLVLPEDRQSANDTFVRGWKFLKGAVSPLASWESPPAPRRSTP